MESRSNIASSDMEFLSNITYSDLKAILMEQMPSKLKSILMKNKKVTLSKMKAIMREAQKRPKKVKKKEKPKQTKWIDLLKYPVLTEKEETSSQNCYTFLVDPKADKRTIKKAFEYLFDVKVKKVNTLLTPRKLKGRKKRNNQSYSSKGYTSVYKKARLKLAGQQSLDFKNSLLVKN